MSLGSNMGNRLENLINAEQCLTEFGEIVQKSRIYETKPVSMGEGVQYFYNQIIEYSSSLDPVHLIEKIELIERRLGRVFKGKPVLSRPIDIDIIFAEEMILEEEGLTIPHRDMYKRAFVLVPLNEIAPNLVHPILKCTIKDLYLKLEDKKGIWPLGVLGK